MSGSPDDRPTRFEQYVASVADRLHERGYSRRDDGPAEYRTTVFHDRSLSLTKFGFVDTFVILGEFRTLEPDTAAAYSRAAFQYGLSEKTALPRGLGSSLVVYPVAVGYDVPPRTLDWVEADRNNHWSAFEFPAVVDLSTEEIFYNVSKPLWGRLYYSDFQQTVERALAPLSDRQHRTQSTPRRPTDRPGGQQNSRR